jgi:hypothetical protein
MRYKEVRESAELTTTLEILMADFTRMKPAVSLSKSEFKTRARPFPTSTQD